MKFDEFGNEIIDDEKIIDELKRYNNFPDEILNNQDALTFFLKIIRNDFYLSDQLLVTDSIFLLKI